MTVTAEEVWTGFRPQLFGYIRARARSFEDAEDILQNVILAVHRRTDTLRDDDRVLPWVYRIAHNAIVDFYRKRIPVPTEIDPPDSVDDHPPIAEQNLAPFVASLVAQLPEIYREAIALTELEGMSQVEMARRLGLSVSGAKSRVQRGRAMLRERLLTCCDVEVDCRGRVIDYVSRTPRPLPSDCGCSPR